VLAINLATVTISAVVLHRSCQPDPPTSYITNAGTALTPGDFTREMHSNRELPSTWHREDGGVLSEPVHTNVLLNDFEGWGVTLDGWRLTNRTGADVACTHERFDACGEFGYTLPAKSSAALFPGLIRNIRCRRDPRLYFHRAPGLWDYLQRVCR